jgi:hypothetical protein
VQLVRGRRASKGKQSTEPSGAREFLRSMEALAEVLDVVSGGGDRLLPISKSPYRMVIDHHEFDEGWAGFTFYSTTTSAAGSPRF